MDDDRQYPQNPDYVNELVKKILERRGAEATEAQTMQTAMRAASDRQSVPVWKKWRRMALLKALGQNPYEGG